MLDRPAVVARTSFDLASDGVPHGSANHTDRPPAASIWVSRVAATASSPLCENDGQPGTSQAHRRRGSSMPMSAAPQPRDRRHRHRRQGHRRRRFRREVRAATDRLAAKGLRRPGLAVVLVGDNPASQVYVRNKRARLRRVRHRLGQPRPAPLDHRNRAADADRAVERRRHDRRHPGAGAAAGPHRRATRHRGDRPGQGRRRLPPVQRRPPHAAPPADPPVHALRRGAPAREVRHSRRRASTASSSGASNIVGRPMALELLLSGATVTICHRFTQNLEQFVAHGRHRSSSRSASPASCAASGSSPAPWSSTSASTACPTASSSATSSSKWRSQRASWITPVPGGVGPMTVAILMKNTLESALQRIA